MKNLLLETDEWYRRRLRMVLCKQWKRIRTKQTNLVKLGIPKSKAWEYANSSKSYRHIAKSWILSKTITNDRLRFSGYMFLSDCYLVTRKLN